MQSLGIGRLTLALLLVMIVFGSKAVLGEGDLHKVKHIIIVMQENHSFDNYFGALRMRLTVLITMPTATRTVIATTVVAATMTISV